MPVEKYAICTQCYGTGSRLNGAMCDACMGSAESPSPPLPMTRRKNNVKTRRVSVRSLLWASELLQPMKKAEDISHVRQAIFHAFFRLRVSQAHGFFEIGQRFAIFAQRR
jgi:hypothetical protein